MFKHPIVMIWRNFFSGETYIDNLCGQQPQALSGRRFQFTRFYRAYPDELEWNVGKIFLEAVSDPFVESVKLVPEPEKIRYRLPDYSQQL